MWKSYQVTRGMLGSSSGATVGWLAKTPELDCVIRALPVNSQPICVVIEKLVHPDDGQQGPVDSKRICQHEVSTKPFLPTRLNVPPSPLS